ncbi:MAG: hypothetical protein QG650_424 [Patescibacteria group bacterium]|nr:hypothetical protein [Patescibacteria group bacterium]
MNALVSLGYALVSSLLDVLDTVVYKRAADISSKTKQDVNFLYFFGYLIVLALTPIFFLFFPTEFVRDFLSVGASWKFFLIFAFIAAATIICGGFLTYAYSHEKISVLTPYTQISEILCVLSGFVLFRSETSMNAFVGAIVASLVIFFSNFDWKKGFRFNKYCLLLAVSETFRAIAAVTSAFLVGLYHPFSIVFIQNSFGFVILGAYFLFRPRGFRIPAKRHRFPFVWTNVVSNFCWIFVTAINLFLYREIGLVLAILVSMITLAVTLAASYLVYGDKPDKKDIIVAILVMFCIVA